MNCQICQKNQATVHVTDVTTRPVEASGGAESLPAQEQHVCSLCAQNLFSIAVVGTQPKVKVNIWKLLQVAKQKQASEACPECGMTLAEFRSKGRLGCPHDYELFWPHLAPLLDRVHNATSHTNAPPDPSVDPVEPLQPEVSPRDQHLLDLREKLETAIQQEAYEHAAELRDAIQELESSSTAPE